MQFFKNKSLPSQNRQKAQAQPLWFMTQVRTFHPHVAQNLQGLTHPHSCVHQKIEREREERERKNLFVRENYAKNRREDNKFIVRMSE